MAWVVDTSVVVDLFTGDPLFEPASTACLQTHLNDGLVISPVTFVELGPSISGDDAAAEAFLNPNAAIQRVPVVVKPEPQVVWRSKWSASKDAVARERQAAWGLGFAANGTRSIEAFGLKSSHIGTAEFWTPADTLLAHRLWHQFQQRRRQLQVVKRPVADVLIAAFAERFQGIITRNASDFRNILPTLRIVEP